MSFTERGKTFNAFIDSISDDRDKRSNYLLLRKAFDFAWDHMERTRNQDMLKACKATLLFHSGKAWDDPSRESWFNLTQSTEATTKVLCDFVRDAIEKGAPQW